MQAITLANYLGPYSHALDATAEVREAAEALLEKVNALLLLAEADGVTLHLNRVTGSHIGGSGNGGFRPMSCPIGAPSSKHKHGHAVDIYDPQRELAAWSLQNRERCIEAGIQAMEDPRWTPTWTHWQDQPVASGRFAFVPSNDPPLASALPGQVIV